MDRHLVFVVLACAYGCSTPQHDLSSTAPRAANHPQAERPSAAAPPVAASAAAPPAVTAAPVVLPAANTAAEAPLLDIFASLPSDASSTSIGSPTNGRLEGGVALPLVAKGLRYNDRRDAAARFATGEVIRTLLRAAQVVHDELPGSELVLNDIGLEQGGRIAHHGSHRAGRDADVLFYLLGDDGRPTSSVGAPLDPDGRGVDYKDLSIPEDDVQVRFDADRTWRFVRALIEDPAARLQRIFVVEHLRTLLLAAAERARAPAETIARFADMTCQPSYPHDDHLHLRWYCSDEDLQRGCEDLPPLYPWRAQELAALGIKPVQAKLKRSQDPAPVTTNADAKREVERQKPHPSVLAFLKRREAWLPEPHPGRPYCR